jgi:penicillin-insensitive murein endopeptidase
MPESTLTIEAREEMSAVTMLADGAEPRRIDPALFGAAQLRLLRRAALSPEVGRIFVHPGIKQALCAAAGKDRAWLRTVRPWWGHDSHFHVRLRCPAGEPLCRDQEPPPMGDGCGADLAWWLTEEPWKPTPPPKVPPKPMLLADLPAQCRRVLEAR